MVIVILAVFLFLCKGGSLASAVHSMEIGGHGHGDTMSCCDTESSVSINHDIGEALPSRNLFIFTPVLSLGIAFFVVFYKPPPFLVSYVLSRKKRYGSFRLLHYLILLFSRGILHSKVF